MAWREGTRCRRARICPLRGPQDLSVTGMRLHPTTFPGMKFGFPRYNIWSARRLVRAGLVGFYAYGLCATPTRTICCTGFPPRISWPWRWDHDASVVMMSCCGQSSPKRPQEGHKRPQDDPKMAPKWPQEAPKMPQAGAQDVPREAPGWPQTCLLFGGS